jgi:hypothetical protein
MSGLTGVTLASMVGVLTSVIAGTTVTLIAGQAPRGKSRRGCDARVMSALASLYGHTHVQSQMHVRARSLDEPLFPSPAPRRRSIREGSAP